MPEVLVAGNGRLVHVPDPLALARSDSPAWVPAGPFRAYARHLCEASGLPWRVVALAAGVPPQVMRTLVCAVHHPSSGRLRERDAAALVATTPEWLSALGRREVPSSAAARHVELLLRCHWTPVAIARVLAWPVTRVHDLLEGHGSYSALDVLRARAVCDAYGLLITESELAGPDESMLDLDAALSRLPTVTSHVTSHGIGLSSLPLAA